MQFGAMIIDSLRESRDRKTFWVLGGITGIIALVMLSVGFGPEGTSIFFGTWHVESSLFNPQSEAGAARILGVVVYMIMDNFLGWIGLILMLIATAGFFPSMMSKGEIDVVLAKPISRPKLFLYKYVSGMVFVLVQATAFVLVTFLIVGFRWGVWAPGLLLSIPLMVLLFSYLYCVSVLAAVITRSTVAAVLLSLGAWIGFSLPRTALDTLAVFPELDKNSAIYSSMRVLATIPPKTTDIAYLSARWAGAGLSLDIAPTSAMTGPGGGMNQDQLDQIREREKKQFKVSALSSIGSSLLFEAVVLMLAMWRFCRMDF